MSGTPPPMLPSPRPPTAPPTLADLLFPLQPGSLWQGEGFSRQVVSSISLGGGLALTLAGAQGEMRVDVYPLQGASGPQRAVATTGVLGLSYRTVAGMAPTEGEAICVALAQHIALRQNEVLAALREQAGNQRIREVRGGPLLSRIGHGRDAFYGLDPYIGCLIGCSFCYAQGRAQAWRQLLGLPAAKWGSWVDVRVDAAEILAAELSALPPLPIKMSPLVTDPYHPLERRRRITRACLEVLATEAHQMPLVILTRSASILDDLALLQRIPHLWVGMSVATLDDTIRQRLEPGAASIPARLDTLAQLRAAGLATFAVVQPMLPGDPNALAAALAAVVDSATADTLSGTFGAAHHFANPQLAEALQPAWQQARLHQVVGALRLRGVRVWRGELPPALSSGQTS